MARAQAERQATAVWQGSLLEGSGQVSADTSGVFTDQGVTWQARTEVANGKTSPEELVAAAHASCYAMAFSHALAQAGNPADRLQVTATVGFHPKRGGGFEITYSNLDVRGRVPGMDQAAFEQAAQEGEQGCPVSNALRNNVQINLNATLESA
ncbi:MAG: OsmC family peroxiredoxin [Chloroflexota bacterium]|nr:OsmC family peroxiredoxin [Chloroflexota bacterium]